MSKTLRNTLMCTLLVSMVGASAFAADTVQTKKPSIYSQADSNHDGKLDQSEYNTWLQLRKDRLAKIASEIPDFASLDSNKDGVISKSEMKSGMLAMKAKLQAE